MNDILSNLNIDEDEYYKYAGEFNLKTTSFGYYTTRKAYLMSRFLLTEEEIGDFLCRNKNQSINKKIFQLRIPIIDNIDVAFFNKRFKLLLWAEYEGLV